MRLTSTLTGQMRALQLLVVWPPIMRGRYKAFLMPSRCQTENELLWVRSRGNSKEVVVSIGLRYGIHPLIMEDALEMKVRPRP